jgi:hypothetical protein
VAIKAVTGAHRQPMRLLGLVVVGFLCAFQTQDSALSDAAIFVRDRAFDYAQAFNRPSPLAKEFSGVTYGAEVAGYDEAGRHVKVIQQKPDYALAAFDGQFFGADRGEWGGELVFRDPNGADHRLLEENVHGIFQMPFGIVVFTGLAHMGGIYVVTRRGVVVTAHPLLALPGAPSDVFPTSANDLVFRVQTRRFEKRGAVSVPRKDCYVLDKGGALRTHSCASVVNIVPSGERALP